MMKKAVVVFLILYSFAYTQSFDGISESLAGNYATMSRGVNALAWNPANLAVSRGNTMELNILSFNTHLYNNSFSVDTYNRFFTQEGHGGYWNTKDKSELLDVISDDGLRLDFSINANLLGFAYNNFGLAVQLIGQGYTTLSSNKKPFEIALNGETVDRSYEYDQASVVKAAAYSAIKVSVGYAYPFRVNWLIPEVKDLAVGLSWNQYIGYAVAQTRRANVLLQRYPGEEESIKYAVDVAGRFAIPEDGTPVGSGFGFDLGVFGRYGRDIDFSWSFSNIAASINWKDYTQKVVSYHSDSLAISGEDNNEESTEVEIDSTYDIGSFSTPLPSVMQMGAVYKMSKIWKISAEYHQGLNSAFGNSTTPRVGAGTEYYVLPWLPLRGGFALGGREGSQLGWGFVLHWSVLSFDYSYAIKGALWPTYAKGFFNSFNLKLVF